MHFINPWFLFGLLAIAIPVAIHLFNFRRYKKVFFTNVRFIKEVKQETRKQSQLRHLLPGAARHSRTVRGMWSDPGTMPSRSRSSPARMSIKRAPALIASRASAGE